MTALARSYTYDVHDGKPVVVSAHCTISSADLDQGSDTDQTTRDYARALGGHDGVDDDDAGHILAHRLGGNGAAPTNIFPQAPHDNRGAWREFEGDVYDCIDGSDGGTTASLTWTFNYDKSTDQRPTSMRYAASYDGRTDCTDAAQDFDNQ